MPTRLHCGVSGRPRKDATDLHRAAVGTRDERDSGVGRSHSWDATNAATPGSSVPSGRDALGRRGSSLRRPTTGRHGWHEGRVGAAAGGRSAAARPLDRRASWRRALVGIGGPAVLLVGTYHGKAGQYRSIQAAVDAAAARRLDPRRAGRLPRDDDAHVTSADAAGHGRPRRRGRAHRRICTSAGMNRDTRHRRRHQGRRVRPRAAPLRSTRTSARSSTARPRVATGSSCGRPNDVSIENLTACNFLGGAGDSGNEIWWNGGDGSGKIGLTGYTGAYLTGHSTYFGTEDDGGPVRHLLVELAGPGQLERDLRLQHERLGHVRRRLPPALRRHHRPRLDGEQRPRLLGDQLRAAPSSSRTRSSTTTRTGSTPTPRSPATRRRRRTAPAPTARQPDHAHPLVLGVHPQRRARQQQRRRPRGGRRRGRADRHRHDALGRPQRHGDGQHVREQRRLGHPVRPLPRQRARRRSTRSAPNYGGFQISGLGCVFEPEGDALTGNTYVNDGYFGNPSNADFGQIVLHAGLPSNCYADNNAPGGSAPPNLEQLQPTCGVTTTSTNRDNDAGGPGRVRLAVWPPARPAPRTRPRPGVQLAPLPRGPADHGQPVRRRAVERLVPVGRSSGSSLGTAGG